MILLASERLPNLASEPKTAPRKRLERAPNQQILEAAPTVTELLLVAPNVKVLPTKRIPLRPYEGPGSRKAASFSLFFRA